MRMLQVDVTSFYNPNTQLTKTASFLMCMKRLGVPSSSFKLDFSPPARQLDWKDFKSEILQISKSSNLNCFQKLALIIMSNIYNHHLAA